MKISAILVLITSLLCLNWQVHAQTASTSVTVVADSAILGDYAGVYTFASGSPVQKFTVTAEKKDLFGEADSYGKNKLIKQAKTDTYQSTSSYGSIITFVRDASTKKVTGLTLAAQGSELSAKKDNP